MRPIGVAIPCPKTGRSPNDKRIVEDPQSGGDIWWGSVNIKLQENSLIIMVSGPSIVLIAATVYMSLKVLPGGIRNIDSRFA